MIKPSKCAYCGRNVMYAYFHDTCRRFVLEELCVKIQQELKDNSNGISAELRQKILETTFITRVEEERQQQARVEKEAHKQKWEEMFHHHMNKAVDEFKSMNPDPAADI